MIASIANLPDESTRWGVRQTIVAGKSVCIPVLIQASPILFQSESDIASCMDDDGSRWTTGTNPSGQKVRVRLNP